MGLVLARCSGAIKSTKGRIDSTRAPAFRAVQARGRRACTRPLFKHVPGAVRAKYQYFNLPVGTDPGEPSHPLQVLKAVAQPGDYVLFKLDLDNTAVETSIFKAMLRDAELLGLIDEFVFEYHVNFAPMVPAWGQTIDPNATLADSFQLFAELRRRGMRAHSWV